MPANPTYRDAAPTTPKINPTYPHMPPDGLAEILRPQASDELDQLMNAVKPADLRTTELLALIAILTPARDRKLIENAPPVMT